MHQTTMQITKNQKWSWHTFGSIKACEIWQVGAHDYVGLIVECPQNFFVWIPGAQEQSQTA